MDNSAKRTKQLEKLLRKLRQIDVTEKQQRVLGLVHDRLFANRAMYFAGKEDYARVMYL